MCFTRFFVRLGEYDIRTDDDGPHEDIGISSIVPHEEYNDPLKINDIALLHLVRHVKFKGHTFSILNGSILHKSVKNIQFALLCFAI